ncbi:hypothetical protein [Neobacillus sedimentimangrovi]|uniref:hypothetical protein n=1 Tax=Neobacillus sedimentimangrovi TaxID=2699460 RepID=UPI0013D399A6|nr:hypothetical protein [Neobacillus sedimentimangrovi]
MSNNIVIKVVLPASLGFLALDYLFGDLQGNILIRFANYLVITHLMMYGIFRRNIKKQG